MFRTVIEGPVSLIMMQMIRWAIVQEGKVANLSLGHLSVQNSLSHITQYSAGLVLRTFKTENMYPYTSNVFWCTPEGRIGSRHCASLFATTNLCGISEVPVGLACSAFFTVSNCFWRVG